jgi:branched-chain amino acid transport system substrate-binding protein
VRTRLARGGAVAALALALVVALGLAAGCQAHPGSQTVKVAMNLPITGPFGIYGQTIRDGATMAVDELKAGGSPVELRLDIQDNTGSPADAVTVFQKQSAGQVDIYSSAVKPQTMAIFDRVLAKGYPYFVWIFDAFITRSHPTVLRTWVNYKYEPDKYFAYISYRRAKRVAIACVNFPHTVEEFEKIVIPRLRQMGVAADIEIYEFDTKQYRDIIAKLAAAKPDLFILNGFQENLVGLVRALWAYRLVGDGNVVGTYDLLDAAGILGKDELEGLRVIAPSFNITPSPGSLAWKARFAAKYNRPPLYTDAYSYDMISIIDDAGRRLKLPASPAQWLAALQATRIRGVTGDLAFDDERDLKIKIQVGVYRNGQLTLDAMEGGRGTLGVGK